MKTVLLLAILALVSVVTCQATFLRFAIDDFTVGENNLQITIPNSPQFPISQVSIFTDPGSNPQKLLGGERDLKLAAESGPANRVLTSNVGAGEWTVSTPGGASGFAEMQYDGKDNSFNLANNGLGGFDFTDGGLGRAFTAIIETDVETTYTFTVTSPNGNQCVRTVDIPGTQAPANYYIQFADFTGNCNFASVGAIVVHIEQLANVDSLITLFAIVGEDDPSPSRTPSSTPSPSRLTTNSNTPTPTGTSTRAPTASGTQTPTPTPTTMCMCHCPAFTCELIFDPDDDENNVFYFDDDDHNPFGDPDPESGGVIVTSFVDLESAGSVLEVSLALFAVLLVALF